MSTPAGFGGPHCSEGRSHHTHPHLVCLLPCSHTAGRGKGAGRVPLCRAATLLGRTLIAGSRPRAPRGCAATAPVAAPSDFCYLRPSFSAPPILTAKYLSCSGVAKQHTAPCSGERCREGETRSRSAWAELGVGEDGICWGGPATCSPHSDSSVPSVSRHVATHHPWYGWAGE